MLPDQPLLIFDSGVGGLSIFDAVAARLPQYSYVFACDNAFFPYGTKTEEELVERVHHVLDALIARYQPALIIVACNTASTVALPRLRHHYTLPIVGVVPAIKPAAALSQNRCLGLLATPGTVQRAYTQQLIRDFAADCQVISLGSSELVQMAEDELRGQAHLLAEYRRILQAFFADPSTLPDTIVLGCTHFPLLRDQLAAAAPEIRHWVDSGDAIARRVEQLLSPGIRQGSASPQRLAVMTAAETQHQTLLTALQWRGMAGIEVINVD